jgi:hypothetical protein
VTDLQTPPPGSWAGAPLDAKHAKAQAKAAKAYAKAQRPWFKKKRFLFPIGFVALIAILMVAGGGSSSDTKATAAKPASANGVQSMSSNTDHPPAGDVSISECTTDQFGFGAVKGQIVNHSSKRSNYMISVSFEKDGVKVSEGADMVSDVDPGQTALWDASSLDDAAAGATCKITSVERFAS